MVVTGSAAESVAERVQIFLTKAAERHRWAHGRRSRTALRALAHVRFLVGFPESIVQEDSRGLGDSGISFVRSWLSASASAQRRRLQQQRSRTQDELNAGLTANAVVAGSSRTLVLPSAIVAPPVFFSRGPSSYNYGSLGKVIGHELFHVFSLSTSSDPHNLWSTSPVLRQRSNCILRSYQKVASAKGRTLASKVYALLADLVGLRVAYAAFESLHQEQRAESLLLPDGKMGPEQLFFVAHCALHCGIRGQKADHPLHVHGRHRCHLPLMHMVEFSQAFHCKRGSPMNPQVKCRL
ncbi:neprilysin-like [Haemaphysalis longicornis]